MSNFDWVEICNDAFDSLDSLIGSEQNDMDILLTVLLPFANELIPKDPKNNKFDNIIINNILPFNCFNMGKLDKNKTLASISSFPNSTCKVSDIIESIQSTLKNIICDDEIRYDMFAKEYCSSFCDLDHGIWGTQIYIMNMYISQLVLEKMFSVKSGLGKSICTLIWNVSKDSYSSKLVGNYSAISGDVAKAIFSHNIYPRSFENINYLKGKKWEVNINSEPCCYFAMFVDALQVWGRKKYNHAFLDYFEIYEADSYNIDIRNKKLNISISCDTHNINSVVKKFVNSLDEYLVDASSLISIFIEGN